MARKSLDEMLADLPVSFPDNITGVITPAIVRLYFDNLIKAIRPSYAILSRSAAVTQAVTTVAAPLVFTSADTSSSQGEYTANAAVGRITRLDKGVTQFQFAGNVSSPSNSPRLLTFTIYKNGVASPFQQSQQFTTAGEIVSLTFPAIQSSSTAADYDMYVKSSVNDTFTFSNMVFIAQTIPSNTPL